MRLVRGLRGTGTEGVACERPLLMGCDLCGREELWRCDTYGCALCGETKRRRLQRLIEDGAANHLGKGLHAYFITLNAPGENDHRRWYQGKRPRTRPDCECHRHGMTKGQWNRQESACWNRLRTAMSRDHSFIYAGAVETQKRGMLHRHLVVFVDQPLTFADWQERALAAGYGCVGDIQPLASPGQVGRYLSKYVTKSSRERPDVPWVTTLVNHETGEVEEVAVRATFRLWSSARKWGITMRQIRDVARLQAQARARHLEDLLEALAADTSRSAAGPEPTGSPSLDPP